MLQCQWLKDKMWGTRDKREARTTVLTSATPTQTHSQSSHISCPLFHIPAPSFKLFLSLFFLPPSLSTTPAFDSSITGVWLPVGSSHSEMYEHREKWMANSIKSIIPEAAPCYQQHCKGILMHCLHAQPRPSLFPTPTEIKVVVI